MRLQDASGHGAAGGQAAFPQFDLHGAKAFVYALQAAPHFCRQGQRQQAQLATLRVDGLAPQVQQ